MAAEMEEEEGALDIIRQSLAEGLQKQGHNINDLLNTAYSSDQELAAQWTRCSILPEDNINTPLQYHSPANQFPTAALGLVDFRAIKWQNQPDLPNCQLGSTDMAIFTFDDNPLHIVSIYNPNASYFKCSYDWTWNGVLGLGNSALQWSSSGSILANKARTVLNAGINYDFHGLYLYTQRDDMDNNYFWIDAMPGAVDKHNGTAGDGNTTLTLRFPGITAAPTAGAARNVYCKIALYRWFGGDPKCCRMISVNQETYNLVGGMAQIIVNFDNENVVNPVTPAFPTYSDYYTLRVIPGTPLPADAGAVPPIAALTAPEISAVINAGLFVRQESRCSVLQHFAAKEVESLIGFFSEKGRINALGLRVTDVPMLQYQNGLIAGFVCLNGNSWYQYWQHGINGADSFFNKISSSVGAKVHEIEKGGYMWHKASDDTFYFWQKWVVWNETTRTPSDCFVSLETTRPVNIIAMNATNDPPGVEGNPNGGGCICAATWAIMLEWFCPVSCYPSTLSPYTTQACIIGIDAAGKFPSFVENDSHWDKFLAYSSAIANHGAPLWRALIGKGGDYLGKKFGSGVGKAFTQAGNNAVNALGARSRGKRKA